MLKEGMKALKQLSSEGIRTNVTLVFNPLGEIVRNCRNHQAAPLSRKDPNAAFPPQPKETTKTRRAQRKAFWTRIFTDQHG
jgi:hypothetical protein